MKRSFLVALVIALSASTASAHDLGVMLDAGVPDGANASLVYRPWKFLRLAAGGGTNLIAPGVRAGVSLILPGGLSGSAEYGHYFEGDANGIWRSISGHPDADVPSLHKVGYDYQNLHAGFEFGPSWMNFYIHAGMSHISGQVHDLGATLTKASSGDGTVTFMTDPTVSVWSVSARMGLIVYFAL